MDTQLASQVAAEVAKYMPAHSWAPLLVQFALLVLAAVLGGIFGPYIREAAKNRATLRSIRQLTDAVEDIKTQNAVRLTDIAHQNAVLIEQIKSQNQLKVAAIDKRLQAHQDAFELWRKLNQHLSTDKLRDVIAECDGWWSKHCLYLEDDARAAFSEAYWSAHMYRQLDRKGEASLDNDAITFRVGHLTTIVEAGNRIAKAVSLPGLSNGELEAAARDVDEWAKGRPESDLLRARAAR
ncbi:hypothetical protein [Paraburkholderia caledonica]|uniref:Uncharacterized protein n=1 Tax=Paraburkholderia caledonica TaxID=134536 RepID=A0ABU1L2D2_9BURK|nr:hypothetical protein [Paraburkholderia caledonica]MDR6377325.1 hypothetical protein [Paraburkholderia caledonica]